MRPCGRCETHLVRCVYPSQGLNGTETRAASNKTDRQAEGAFLISAAPAARSDHSGRGNPSSFDVPPSAIGSQSSQRITDLDIESPEFCGPSSAEFTLNVVSGNLRAMGMPAAILDKSSLGPGDAPGPSGSSGRLAQYGPFMKLLAMDPLWEVKKEDADDLIREWCDGVGLMYPVVSRQKMLDTAQNVFTSLHATQSGGVQSRKGSLVETLFNDETNKLKIVIAIGRTLESGGRNDVAQRLFQSTTEAVEGLIWNSNGINGIQLLVLVALYHYHLDEEVRTGRIVGFAARLCLEMGLHRRSVVEKIFPNVEERSAAFRTFCSVYMLERRTSLGQGIPFSIQDSHVDPSLFALVSDTPSPLAQILHNHPEDESNAVASALLEWTKLAGKTSQVLNSQDEMGVDTMDHLDYLDYTITQWYQHLHQDLRFDPAWMHHWGEENEPKYIQAVMFCRKSHLRNLIYRPVLQSATYMSQHRRYVETAMQSAKETIQTFADLNENTPIMRTHPVYFKDSLLAAFGNLLLAIVNGGSPIRESVRAEFEIGLNLIELLSTRSTPLMRLWQRLQGLRDLHRKLFKLAANESAEVIDVPTGQGTPAIMSFDAPFSASQPSLTQLKEAEESQLYPDHVRSEGSLGLANRFDFPFIDWLDLYTRR
ncbi:hypothetical protein NW761_014884 [Fusarium oxysporum]|nr:hypothetical protein NW758_010331 [Fusarium oxysporum]KAJ4072482.1 hypothetical protein NW761_014884 [Fusarium oxysporum]KAJ4089641.1 hypothetical protein NW769_013448 [Fusarium oxysporum]KAJ4220842.1 hypothetical protein NW760_012008 [Fusarium oxysporum]WKT40257.1 hypothetical protein QSH57_002076 [Fusarium oxysporum f. sp. vasinfectum]